MSKGTLIQWCDDTVNPTSGCDGCELWVPGKGGPCYAGNLHQNRLSKTLPLLYDPVFTNVRAIPGRMAKAVRCMDLTGVPRATKPWLSGKARKLFIGDLGDVFSKAVSFDYLKTEIIEVAVGKDGARHDYLLLTKQPQRAVKFAQYLNKNKIEWPENVWIGCSITNKASLGRIAHLAKVPARHRYLSIEPLVGDPELALDHIVGKVDWMIVGGESSQGAYPGRPFQLEWARKIVELGKQAEIAVFVKQFGSVPMLGTERVVLTDSHGGDWSEWPADLQGRQMPFGCR
jgi:protein gp37